MNRIKVAEKVDLNKLEDYNNRRKLISHLTDDVVGPMQISTCVQEDFKFIRTNSISQVTLLKK